MFQTPWLLGGPFPQTPFVLTGPYLTPGFAMMLVPKHRAPRNESWIQDVPQRKPRHCACCVDSGLHVPRGR